MTQTKAQLIDGKSAEIEFSGGSAGAPAISFTGDTNTGIYSPGADQLALSTNGTGRLFVTSDGKVGVGVSSPLEVLHVKAGTSGVTAELGGVDGAIIESGLGRTGGLIFLTPNDRSAGVIFSDPDGASRGYYRYDHNGDYAHIATAGSERLRITSDGKVGVGTSSPATNLHIASTNAQLRLQDTDGTDQFGQVSESAGVLYLFSRNGTNYGEIKFQQNNGTTTLAPLVIDSSQRVGIGTQSPLEPLHIENLNADLMLRSTSDVGNSRIFFADPSSTNAGLISYTHTDNSLSFNVNGGERFRCDSSGRLLVGTSSGSGNSLMQVQEQRLNGGDGYSQVKTKLLSNPAKSTDHTLFTLSSTGTAGGSLGINKSSAAFTLSINLMLNNLSGGNAHVCYTVRGVITKNFTGNISLTLGTPEQITHNVGANTPGFTVKLTSASQTSANLAVNFTTADTIDDCKLAAKIETIGSNTTHGPMLVG